MFRNVNLYIITAAGVFVLVAYIRSPRHFFLFFLLAVIVLFSLYLSLWPSIRRQKRAAKIASKGGEYRLEITEGGIVFGDKREKINFGQQRRKLQLFSSKHVYTVKTDKEIFTVPKRILDENENEELEKILKRSKGDVIRVVIT